MTDMDFRQMINGIKTKEDAVRTWGMLNGLGLSCKVSSLINKNGRMMFLVDGIKEFPDDVYVCIYNKENARKLYDMLKMVFDKGNEE